MTPCLALLLSWLPYVLDPICQCLSYRMANKTKPSTPACLWSVCTGGMGIFTSIFQSLKLVKVVSELAYYWHANNLLLNLSTDLQSTNIMSAFLYQWHLIFNHRWRKLHLYTSLNLPLFISSLLCGVWWQLLVVCKFTESQHQKHCKLNHSYSHIT